MKVDNFLLVLGYTCLTAVIVLSLRRIKRGNPAFWFILFQWVMAAGSMAVLDTSRHTDMVYAILFYLALLGFFLGVLLAYSALNVSLSADRFWSKPIEVDHIIPQIIIVLLVLLSCVITVLYYKAVGYNLFVDLAFGDRVKDFVSARLATYSGKNYFAPGYVNQFKNVILPVGFTSIILSLWYSHRKVLAVSIGLAGMPMLLYALLGTGQRAPLVFAFCITLFALSILVKLSYQYIAIAGSVVVVLFGWLSFYLHHISVFTFTASVEALLKRIFVNEQGEGIIGFRYVFDKPVVWFSEWGQGFLGLSPWNKGSTLEHQVYNVINGTPRGTSTISTIASITYNASVYSVPFAYFLLGIIYVAIYRRLLDGPRSVIRCVIYGGLFFYLAIWITGSPVGLVNHGVVTLLIMLFLRKLSIDRDTLVHSS